MTFDDIDVKKFGNVITLAGAIFSENGQHYHFYFPKERDAGDIMEQQLTIEQWNALLRQTDLLEVAVDKTDETGKLTKAILRKSQRQIDGFIQWKVFKRDNYTCCYCGNDDIPLTVDHLVTWEEGGPTTEENLLSSCRKCNKTRDTLPFEQWLKHPYYKKVSQGLSPIRRMKNDAIVSILHTIEKQKNTRSR